ncbi:glycosyltransferase family 4 protein [Amnibacterium soli]|uniref:Glycosyltransferase family 4 protein n=1 Tax=Amnibacterium soli TaxID=1282736 RepID=A0ABP8ZDK2_9MICO
MRIDLVYPVLPPVVDGIADHTVLLARALVEDGHRVRLLSRASDSPQPTGLEVVAVWPRSGRVTAGPLVEEVVRGEADAVVLQFEQFAYGHRGINPDFARTFGMLRSRHAGAVRVLYAHETWTSPERLAWIPLWIAQRAQFRALVRSADVVVVAAEQWLERVRRVGGSAEQVPIFSNIPVSPEGAAGLPLDRDDAVVVWFGYVDSRRAVFLDEVVRVLSGRPGSRFVYVGKDGDVVDGRLAARGIRYEIVPTPTTEVVSAWLRAADVCVAPFVDGVSARRGSFLAALAHGARVVTTIGPDTDRHLRHAAHRGVYLAGDEVAGFGSALREALGGVTSRGARTDVVSPEAAAEYARHFAPEAAAARLLDLIAAASRR